MFIAFSPVLLSHRWCDIYLDKRTWRYFHMFDSMLSYLLESGSELAAGHTMQIGNEEYLRFREPNEAESFLEGDGEIFVAEVIGAAEINR